MDILLYIYLYTYRRLVNYNIKKKWVYIIIAPTGNVTGILSRWLPKIIPIRRNSILSLSEISKTCLRNTLGLKTSSTCYRKTTGPIGSKVHIKTLSIKFPTLFRNDLFLLYIYIHESTLNTLPYKII